jgi:tetrahydromethanopterin S-methyltransferase subunit C
MPEKSGQSAIHANSHLILAGLGEAGGIFFGANAIYFAAKYGLHNELPTLLADTALSIGATALGVRQWRKYIDKI